MRLISEEPDIQARYEECLENGCTEKLAEALAFQQGPALRTDVSFLQGHSNGNQFAKNPKQGAAYAARAKRAGVSTQGKIYLHGLARYPGDPEAWVGDRSDVSRVLERRNWSARGVVSRTSREPENPPVLGCPGGVAEDILDSEVDSIVQQEPEAAPTHKERVALKEKLRAKRRPHWSKG